MKQKFICILIFLMPFVSNAASWFQGSLVLSDHEVLVGELSIESKYDMVLFRHNGRVDVYPAHKVSTVLFYDGDMNVNRKFISIQHTTGLFKPYRLFEVVISGEVSLLRKENFEDPANDPEHDANGFYYLIRYGNELISLKKFRSRIYPVLKNSSIDEFTAYIKKHRLNPNIESNAIRIIQYYNEQTVSHRQLSMN